MNRHLTNLLRFGDGSDENGSHGGLLEDVHIARLGQTQQIATIAVLVQTDAFVCKIHSIK